MSTITPKPKETTQLGNTKKDSSMFMKILACVLYGGSSAGLTFINKSIYEKFGFASPLDLLLTQCICNVVICLTMMTYKQFNPNSFQTLEQCGMKITPLNQVISKFGIGASMGLGNLITVLFGVYSVKEVNIPLFLTFRRCAILTTIIVNFIVNKAKPDRMLSLSTLCITLGAVIAGYDTLNSDMFGYFLIMMNNISQSLYNIYVQKVNQNKLVTAFEINFFFAACGLPILLAITLYTGEIYLITDILKIPDLTYRMWYLIYMTLSGVMGIVITLSILLVCTLCAPVAVNITGTIKDVMLTYVGFVFFENVHISVPVFAGLSVSFLGAATYGLDQYWKQNKQKTT